MSARITHKKTPALVAILTTLKNRQNIGQKNYTQIFGQPSRTEENLAKSGK